MRSCSKERTNIPITISVLHDQEYQLCRLLHRSGRRRAFTERHGMDPLFGEQNMLTRFQRGMDPQQVDSPSDAKKAKQKK